MTSGASSPVRARPVTPVAILAAKLDALVERLAVIDGVDVGVLADLDAARELAGGLDPYVEQSTTPESPALARLAKRTQSFDWDGASDQAAAPLEQEMLSGHVEGQLLKMLVRISQATRVLDIGMFTGYSALAMAEALPSDGQVVACEIDADVAAFARESFDASPDGHKIVVEVGPAGATLEALAAEGRSFDLVFIDADKGGYADYLDAVLDRELLAPDGVICVDNTLMQGHPWCSGESTPNGAAIAAFNRAVRDDPRVEQVLVPLRDGVTLMCRAHGYEGTP